MDYERLIHQELRLIRQRAHTAIAEPVAPATKAGFTEFDYTRFAERFRGSEEYVREGQRYYLPYFKKCTSVLDIGCGRGEFLELMRETGVPAQGIDLDSSSVEMCRDKGLSAEVADLFRLSERRKRNAIRRHFRRSDRGASSARATAPHGQALCRSSETRG